MNFATKNTLALAAGLVMGAVYFVIGESSIPKDSKCDYLTPWTTDAIAWLFGIIVTHYGFKYNQPILLFVGGSVASIHVVQFAVHKTQLRLLS
tara:strand:+ start:1089 stop:1367 length:279 start_codon:yes stop_codon:yes gene_type:complete